MKVFFLKKKKEKKKRRRKFRRVEEWKTLVSGGFSGLSSIPVVYFKTNNDLLVNILGICGSE